MVTNRQTNCETGEMQTGGINGGMQRDMILTRLKERGCRITKQRLQLIDVILENECSSCKEIFYKASEKDSKLGTATVYRMINLLEDIGAISRKNMYKVAYPENCTRENAATVFFADGTQVDLSAKKWNRIVLEGLKSCGYLEGKEFLSLSVLPCECDGTGCK